MTAVHLNCTPAERSRGVPLSSATLWVLLKKLRLRGVELITNARRKDIAADRVVYTDAHGNDAIVSADRMVMALGSRSENSPVGKLAKIGIALHAIRDARKAGRISDAIEEGRALAT